MTVVDEHVDLLQEVSMMILYLSDTRLCIHVSMYSLKE